MRFLQKKFTKIPTERRVQQCTREGGGGLPHKSQFYIWGGSLGTSNLYYVKYGRPLNNLEVKENMRKDHKVDLEVAWRAYALARRARKADPAEHEP